MKPNVPKEIRERARLVRGKRARLVVAHILRQGSITTEDLERYGYKHPPRAIRDVREQGIPLDMFWTQNRDGRRISGYRFGDPKRIRADRLGGRRVISKRFAKAVIQQHGCRCEICRYAFEERYLQIDHRIPYELGPEAQTEERNPADYMPLCGSCNRAKSWSCEHCENWSRLKAVSTCQACYWAFPDSYTHVAMREIRRLDLVWEGSEVNDYEILAADAVRSGEPMPEFVKEVLRRHLRSRGRSR